VANQEHVAGYACELDRIVIIGPGGCRREQSHQQDQQAERALPAIRKIASHVRFSVAFWSCRRRGLQFETRLERSRVAHAGTNLRATPLLQYLRPVGGGPSLNT